MPTRWNSNLNGSWEIIRQQTLVRRPLGLGEEFVSVVSLLPLCVFLSVGSISTSRYLSCELLPLQRAKELTFFASVPFAGQVQGSTLHNRRYGSLVPCRWRCSTSRNMLTGLGTLWSPRFITPMERSGEFFVTSPISVFPPARWFIFVLLTDTLFSHPSPFKYAIKPRSEKSAALVASIEL